MCRLWLSGGLKESTAEYKCNRDLHQVVSRVPHVRAGLFTSQLLFDLLNDLSYLDVAAKEYVMERRMGAYSVGN